MLIHPEVEPAEESLPAGGRKVYGDWFDSIAIARAKRDRNVHELSRALLFLQNRSCLVKVYVWQIRPGCWGCYRMRRDGKVSSMVLSSDSQFIVVPVVNGGGNAGCA